MDTILVATLFVLLVIQIAFVARIITIIKQLNKLLFEVRLLYKHSGISYEPRINSVVDYKICQYCKFRLSFIQITDKQESDSFYYKCKIHNRDIVLSDSCTEFKRDLNFR